MLFAVLAGSAIACGGHTGGTGAAAENDETPAECEAFAAAYEHCLGTLGPEQIAKARVEQTRASFVAQASRGEAARAALRAQCSANLAQIKSTCR